MSVNQGSIVKPDTQNTYKATTSWGNQARAMRVHYMECEPYKREICSCYTKVSFCRRQVLKKLHVSVQPGGILFLAATPRLREFVPSSRVETTYPH